MPGTPIILAVALVFFIAAAFLLYYQKRQIQAQKRQIEAINQELEKRLLRAQINPHFLFNSLSSIQHFITNNDKVAALKYLSKFSTLLRQMLEQSSHIQVVLADEIKLLQNYLDLEALRFDEQFSYSIETDPEVDVHNTEVPILLVQPFVENAILHGLAPKKGPGKLTVRFSDDSTCTVCTIRDDGIGRLAAMNFKRSFNPKKTSRGLTITQKRLDLLQYDPSIESIQITDLLHEDGSPAGTEVVVRIPKLLK
jgi:sensor histidine kinase YesM